MDCYQHPGTTSTATCVSCAQPICPECREEVAGHPMCRPCMAAASARLVDAAGPSAGTPPAAAFASAPVSGASTDAAAIGMPVGQSAGPMASLSADYGTAPGFMRRVGRGAFWGLIYGQWWTLLRIVWSFVL